MNSRDSSMLTLFLRRSASLLAACALLGGCINSPQPAGSDAHLYHWEDRDIPVASRTGIMDTEYQGYFDGDLDFTQLLIDAPDLYTGADAPYLLESCVEEVCYYAVLFPGDFRMKANGTIGGFAAMTPLSTAMYADVRELPAEQVRPRLDSLAALVTTDDAAGDYAGFVTLDYQRVARHAALIADPAVSDEAERRIQAGELPSLSELLGSSITTGDLQAPGDFIFSSAWQLVVDADVARRLPNAYLAICREYQREGDGYDVNYGNCLLKTPLAEGRFQTELRMQSDATELLAVLIPLDDPEALEYHSWSRAADGETLTVR